MSSSTHVPMISSWKWHWGLRYSFFLWYIHISDLDVIWTRTLLIWSQTRYHCATRPCITRFSLYFYQCLATQKRLNYILINVKLNSCSQAESDTEGWDTLSFFHTLISLTLTWFEHAPFWSGVRRATIAPQGLVLLNSHYIFVNVLPPRKDLIIY